MKSTLIVLAALAALAASKIDYTGHMVVRVVPQKMEQLQALQSMEYDFWSSPSFLGKAVDIRVSPEQYVGLLTALNAVNLEHTIAFDDIGKLILQEERNVLLRKAMYSGRAFDFANYHTLEELYDFLNNELAAQSSLVSTSVIGTTTQGRDIVMATVSTAPSAGKPVLYFDCAMHAREWVTPAACVWMINELATKYGSDEDVTTLLDAFDWKITPVSNPDGFVHTHTSDRLWRKNRQSAPGSTCLGTDPNRNFDAGFGGPGTSSNPCSDTYRGPSAFSTPEASAMRDVLAANRGRVKASVSIHAYSQYWMSPYGYTSALPADYNEMYRVMGVAVQALTATYGTRFVYGNIADVIYLASGSTADFAYDNEGVLHSYALELRDTGSSGFLLPPNQILPTSIETFNGLKAMAFEILKTL